MTARTQQARSSVPGARPQPSEIEVGQLWVNLADGGVYTKTTQGNIIPVGMPEAPTDGRMYARRNRQWEVLNSIQGSGRFDKQFSHVSGETDFIFPFNVHDLDVFLNGILLMPGIDYTTAVSLVKLTSPVQDDESLLLCVTQYGDTMRSDHMFNQVAGQSDFVFAHNQQDLSVFLNGVLLQPQLDYTADGAQVRLSSPVQTDDDTLFIITRS